MTKRLPILLFSLSLSACSKPDVNPLLGNERVIDSLSRGVERYSDMIANKEQITFAEIASNNLVSKSDIDLIHALTRCDNPSAIELQISHGSLKHINIVSSECDTATEIKTHNVTGTTED